MTTIISYIITFFYLTGVLKGDIYLHNMRGSNNRLDGNKRERTNGNRLFDSQNNGRGGYNVGNLYYYAGSKLQLEWTNQHSCQDVNAHCEIIIQYMCDDKIRDGATERTIPVNNKDCDKENCDLDFEYGMHESNSYYKDCLNRKRNLGLFVANQKLKLNSISTRQNNKGTRYGYECPEERDYYPYWAPSPWKDIAILTNDATRCPSYQAESENVKSRYYCKIPETILLMNPKLLIEHTETNCKKLCDGYKVTNKEITDYCGWTESPSHNLPEPDCRETEYSRDNHLGNTFDGQPQRYNWTLPNINHEQCILRIRYNISTGDYNGWNISDEIVSTKLFGFKTDQEANGRGYVFKNNPNVDIFPDYLFAKKSMKLQLNVNTDQFGRTFQDRSHTFSVRPLPDELKDAKILHNVNVRGKRGNIVQVYPAVEYDFVPNTLVVAKNDYVHFQWTGSNTNPNNNDGQGAASTDRSNVVVQANSVYNETFNGEWYGDLSKYGHWGRSYPNDDLSLTVNSSFLGFSQQDRHSLAFLSPPQNGGELSELDDASTYFDMAPKKITLAGIFNYLCTRNNNFSNRSQKGRIIVLDGIGYEFKVIGWNGGTITSSQLTAEMKIERGTFSKLQKIQIKEIFSADVKRKLTDLKANIPSGKPASNLIIIEPEEMLTANLSRKFQLSLNYEKSSNDLVTVYYSSSRTGFSTWTKLKANFDTDNKAIVQVSHGGAYIVTKHNQLGLILGLFFGLLAIILIVLVITAIYLRNNPKAYNNVKRRMFTKV